MNEESKVSCLKRGSKMNYFFVFNRSEIKGCCGTPLPQPSLSVPPAPFGITSIWFYLTLS